MTQQPFEFASQQIEADIRAKIAAVHAKNVLIPCETAVLLRLGASQAFGSDHAVSIAAMQEQWRRDGLPVYGDRSIKAAIKTLLEEHNLPIGACRIAPRNGYHFVTSDEEAEAAVRPLKAEIFSMFRRIKILAPRSAFVRKLQGQLELLEGE
jgi:hypothetical protein